MKDLSGIRQLKKVNLIYGDFALAGVQRVNWINICWPVIPKNVYFPLLKHSDFITDYRNVGEKKKTVASYGPDFWHIALHCR